MKAYKAAAVQLNSQPNLDFNLEIAYKCIKEAAQNDALLVGLPENFAFLGDLSSRLEKATHIATQTEKFLSDTAEEFGIYLLGGGFPVLAASGKVLNRSLLTGPDGRHLAQYDKIHLFDVDLEDNESYLESDYVQAGKPETELYVSDDIGSIGLSICYDLRFPELYRDLISKGADVLTIPAAFTKTTGKAHWHALLRARAIENTSYVFAPAQTGTHGKNRHTYGHSLIIDPWGRVLADGGEKPGIIYADISPDLLKEVRTSIPSLKHRRL